MSPSNASRPQALVTGASAGIGVAFAESLARKGFDLVLVARRRDRMEALAKRLLQENGAKSDILAADLADPQGLAEVERWPQNWRGERPIWIERFWLNSSPPCAALGESYSAVILRLVELEAQNRA